jgi:DNA helicase-2/ATP-dependent DNA helicase PcrA
MRERIAKLVGQEKASQLRMGTFHSVFASILRYEASKIGYDSNFTIYDQTDSRSLLKSIIREIGLDEKVYKPAYLNDIISTAKNNIILPDEFVNCSLYDNKKPKVLDVYKKYLERCRQANAMDFDDLLLQMYLLLDRNPDVCLQYALRFHYILIDEYQDTNIVQSRIIKKLCEAQLIPNMVCAVGDDAQSIYSFRGANIDNILNFENDFKGSKKFLTFNYRSTKNIVNAANSLIKMNKFQITDKPVIQSNNPEGDKVTLKPAYSDKEEAIIVCKDIQRIRRNEHAEYSDFAILYRTNAQSRSFEEQMRKDGIPYRIYGGLSFYQRKEIKDVIAYFRLVSNPNDEEALKRIINYPARGIGDTTLNKIVTTATTYGVSLWTVIQQPTLFHLEISAGTAKKVEAFRQLVEGWGNRKDVEDAYLLGHAIIQESGISKDIYSSRNPEDLSRQENLEEFLGGMQDFVESRREEGMGDQVSLSDFLQEVALLTDLDSDADENQSKVSLMTIHSAKGLEFPTVFVVGLEENIFPSPMCVNSMRELEEERRLLYVAVTRAEKHCILTCAQNRFRFGHIEFNSPSRFIRDFDPTLLRVEGNLEGGFRSSDDVRKPWQKPSEGPEWMQNPRPVATQFKADPKPRQIPVRKPEPAVNPFSASFERQLNMASNGRFKPVSRVSPTTSATSQPVSLAEGVTIEHQRFGIGKVIKIEGAGDNEKATVEFRNAGTKQLLLKFAKFRIV